ncbi:MAG: phytoene/squalene synthase family protein [Actinomycetales bacterium]|nr:phytoene/squalene synthase family protein [Actinomycetales bacterium]
MNATVAPTGLSQYTRAAEAACNQVIAQYSTSFGWATKLLSRSVRQPVRNIYALVRVADEIVDGAAAQARAAGGKVDPAVALDNYEAAVYQALTDAFATDLVIHAFASTARDCGFGRDLIEPFFASMRADLTETVHDSESLARYIYGSAEVVGLMCLAAFIRHGGLEYSREEKLRLAEGAKALGSAFQKVNFLRDLAADFNTLGRSYFPGITATNFTDADRDRLVAEIDEELAIAANELPNLPPACSRAVAAALMLFAELNRKISVTPAAKLATTRIRVSNARKLVLVTRAYFGGKA